jgi:hypothetical protein
MLTSKFRWLLAFAVALVSIIPLPAVASDDDFTDIWYAGETESGWGVNMVQSQDAIFATFFVHGPAPSTTEFWYVATIYRQFNGSYTGDLYQTTGTGIGATWNPAQKTVTKVGTATFSPTSTTTGSLTYNVGAVVVNKNIVRQTLTSIALGGAYTGTTVAYDYSCSNPSNAGTFTAHGSMSVSQTATRMTLAVPIASDACTFDGAYLQEGQLFRIPSASFVCRNGGTTTLNTTASVYALKLTAVGFEFQWYAPSVFGCQEDGVVAAVYP